MNRRSIILISALFFLILSSTLLITGSSILTFSLSESAFVPLGTFITWLGMISLPVTILHGLAKTSEKPFVFFTIAIKALIALAILWLPICFLLAGNISFSFGKKESFQGGQLAMQFFWLFNYFVVMAPIALLLAYIFVKYVRICKTRKSRPH
jgi:hypothetical protein